MENIPWAPLFFHHPVIIFLLVYLRIVCLLLFLPFSFRKKKFFTRKEKKKGLWFLDRLTNDNYVEVILFSYFNRCVDVASDDDDDRHILHIMFLLLLFSFSSSSSHGDHESVTYYQMVKQKSGYSHSPLFILISSHLLSIPLIISSPFGQFDSLLLHYSWCSPPQLLLMLSSPPLLLY